MRADSWLEWCGATARLGSAAQAERIAREMASAPVGSLPYFDGLGITRYDTLADRLRKLGRQEPLPSSRPISDPERRLRAWLRDGVEASRRRTMAYRIGAEMERLCVRGEPWYPVFLTLTVDRHACPRGISPRQLVESGAAWTVYLRQLSEVVRLHLGYAQPQRGGPPRSAYVRYARVVEHGKSREHHHIHAMLWLRSLPLSWCVDPTSTGNPRRCEIDGMRSLWPYGFSSPRAFRFAGSDPWTRLGWSMPLARSGRSLRLFPPGDAGGYLAKYLTKEHRQWKHRIAMTRGLGLRYLRRLMARLSLSDLVMLAQRPPEGTMIYSAPVALLRRMARSMSLQRIWDTSRRTAIAWTMTTPRRIYGALLNACANPTPPWSMDSAQLSAWLHHVCPVDGSVYSDVWDRVYAWLGGPGEPSRPLASVSPR